MYGDEIPYSIKTNVKIKRLNREFPGSALISFLPDKELATFRDKELAPCPHYNVYSLGLYRKV